MAVVLRLCAILLAISPWILRLGSANKFCSGHELDKQCSEYSYQIIKPMMEYFAQVNEKIEKFEEKSLAYDENEKKEADKFDLLQGQISQLTKLIESVVQKKDEVNTFNVKNRAVNKTITGLEEILEGTSEFKKELNRFENKLQLLDSELSNCKGNLTIQALQVVDIGEKNKIMLEERSECQTELDKFENKALLLDTEVSICKTNLSTQVQINIELEVITIKKDEEKSLCEKKLGEYSNLTMILQGKEKELANLLEINNNSSQQMSEMNKTVESLNNQISQKDTQLGEYSTQVSNIKMILQGKEKELANLLEINNNSSQQMSEMNKTVESLNNKISQKETQLGEYSTQVSNIKMILQNKEKELSEMNKTVESLNNRISQQKTQLGEYSTQQFNFTRIIQDKEKEIADLKNDAEQKEIGNRELNKTIESLNSQISNQQSQLSEQLNTLEYIPNSCSVMNNYSGILPIKLDGLGQFNVSCDSLSAGSGWTVIQRRINGSENFYRNWEEYKQGFGNVEGEFFIGLEKLHLMTKKRRYELYIHLVDQANKVAYARYNNFRVANETNKYELLSTGDFNGTVGDSMWLHRGVPFSTYDRDNDKSTEDCATTRGGGWWYFYCADSNLNGKNFDCAMENISNELEKTGCIFWHHWHGRSYSLKNVQMMIRPWRHV